MHYVVLVIIALFIVVVALDESEKEKHRYEVRVPKSRNGSDAVYNTDSFEYINNGCISFGSGKKTTVCGNYTIEQVKE